jgi:hypothetical protein
MECEVIGVAAPKNAKNPTSGNDTPNTPGVSESAIAGMKVAELRRELRARGVKGTDDLKKPELVKRLIKLETTESKSSRSAGKKSTSASTTRSVKTPAASTATKKSASVATTKKLAAAAIDRSTAKKLASAAGELPTTTELLYAQTDPPSSDDVPTTLQVGKSRGGRARGKSGGGKRTGKAALDTVKYS